MHWLSPAPAGVAGPAGVTCRRARLKSRLKAERIYLPKEPAGAAIRAPSALDVPADWLEAFQSLVNSAYHSVFTFLVRVERIYSDSWLSSSLAAKLLRGVTRPSADVYSTVVLCGRITRTPLGLQPTDKEYQQNPVTAEK